MKRCIAAVLAVLMLSTAISWAQWPDRSSELKDTGYSYDTGLLVGGCVVAGVSLITALALSSPDPELFVRKSEMAAQSERVRTFGKPVRLDLSAGDVYGIVDSTGRDSLRVRTREGTVAVSAAGIRSIMDLASAAKKSRVGKTKALIAMSGGGLGLLLIGASENPPKSTGAQESVSNITKIIMYGASGILVLSGIVTFASRSEAEQEHAAWGGPEEEENEEGGEEEALGSRWPQVGLTAMRVTTYSPSGVSSIEMIPAVRASISLW